MSRALDRLASFDRYSATAERASKQVIDAYSTSFGMATRLLGRRHRRHVRNIYALVRVADELVDGVASEAGLTPLQQHRALTALAEETASALALGYSCNPVVHAFARTARESGIDATLIDPFFSSMRADLPPLSEATSETAPSDHVVAFGFEAHRDYVHGSAEVVGLMCLRVFLREEPQDPEQRRMLEHGARQLGPPSRT
ncbi:phytoene/squalene synthase family protein [Microbacterium sp. NIBRBAC000506063]|uniref:phytoene/squalene synthase family protein n=1 Tax=Microbacterium sp. NIBRBAC000506063 TaxID=2734618 RepID=UPI002948BCDD|nr:squalene/phytoene synthase family protein [Microbacterium sp. NIBRBAC000506063]